MKVGGFILLCALSGVIFTLIQEFKRKCMTIGRSNSENQITTYDAVMSIFMNLLAIVVVVGLMMIYGRVLCYRPSGSIALVGFIVIGISHKVFKKLRKKGGL
jgi:ABC-type protease/lipase transport system fused ATPase/permease subunit